MPRVKLHEQKEYEFHYDVTVQVRQINSTGHLDHKAVIEIIHDARATLFHSLGLSERNIGDGHTGIIMVDLIINFKEEGFAFDQLRVDTHVGEISEKSFRMFHRIMKRGGGTIIALAEMGFIIYDYTKGAITSMPEPFLKSLDQMKQNMQG
jgi:acyl-CoA thioester hydrolase